MTSIPRASFLPRAWAVVITMLVSAVVPSASVAQDTTTRVLLRQLVGDLAIEVRAAPAGALDIGAADSTKSVQITLMATDVVKWADSAKRILTARPRGRSTEVRRQAAVEEPGIRSGSLVVSRTINPPDTIFAIQVSDSSFEQVRTVVDSYEAAAFVGALRRVAEKTVAAARVKVLPKRPR